MSGHLQLHAAIGGGGREGWAAQNPKKLPAPRTTASADASPRVPPAIEVNNAHGPVVVRRLL